MFCMFLIGRTVSVNPNQNTWKKSRLARYAKDSWGGVQIRNTWLVKMTRMTLIGVYSPSDPTDPVWMILYSSWFGDSNDPVILILLILSLCLDPILSEWYYWSCHCDPTEPAWVILLRDCLYDPTDPVFVILLILSEWSWFRIVILLILN